VTGTGSGPTPEKAVVALANRRKFVSSRHDPTPKRNCLPRRAPPGHQMMGRRNGRRHTRPHAMPPRGRVDAPISRAPPVAPPAVPSTAWYGPQVAPLGGAAGAPGRGQERLQASEASRAMAAVMSTASSLDLAVDDAIVLHDSNKLTLRLLPCDVLARVAHVAHQVAQFEIELAQQLAESRSPVAALDPRVEPRVYERDGFVVTLWTYYKPATRPEVSPADYANALERLHAGLRKLDVPAPHFTDRIEQAQQLVASRDHTPALAEADRELLGNTLRSLKRVIGNRGGAEQLLHGEPHPGNVLTTDNGLLFIDLETCCRGPVEFDLAHAPEEVSEHYPGVNRSLLRECRILVLAMITTWRWDRGDQFPNGRQLGTEWLSQIRAALDRNGLNTHG
jgi:phosphotransferase family enzyme